MNGMKEVFNKELARIFKDRKMVFSVFILPVVIMIGIMSIMSTMISTMENDIDSHKSVVYIANVSDSFRTFLQDKELNYNINEIATEKEIKGVKSKILNGEADILIEFPKEFDNAISNYKVGDLVPQIRTYYNPSEDYSSAAHSEIAQGLLEKYRMQLLGNRVGNLEQIAVFTVDSDNKGMIIQDADKASGKALGMMLPYFITILLFAGAMGIGTDMIAGEKERGTMSSLLVTPIKR
ncbi:MAG: ABC transporter permease, partial [Lachnospiraceae bacterium]|nr:ABC transporter permease [Lachnospiraceae bacterium]